MPKFSVVIAVYNKERYIGATLKSVLNQTFQDFEVIIVNDGSTDRSEEEITTFQDPRIHYYKQKNKGAAGARNAAIDKATALYIALLDADDIWDKNYLLEQNKLIEAYPEEFVFATGLRIFEHNRYKSSDYSIDIRMNESGTVNYFKASFLSSILHSSTTVVKKIVFEEVGYYDPSIKSGQDTDLYVRIGLAFKVVFLNKELVTYNNMVSNSLFKSIKNVNDKANFIAYEKYEKDNKSLKKFLDLNRFSLCVLAKVNNDKKNFEEIYNKIDKDSLNKKQLFILKSNKNLLIIFLKIKKILASQNINFSIFK